MKSLIKKMVYIFMICFMIVGCRTIGYAATAGEIDSHGNIVPAGREEVDRSKPIPRGWGSLPQNTEEAIKQGYSKRIPMRVNKNNNVYYWVRETEIVPVGKKPLAVPNEYLLETDVPGLSKDKDYSDSGTAVIVRGTRYIYDEGDFEPPGPSYNGNRDMMAPFREIPTLGFSKLPVPAYSFTDSDLRYKYLSKVNKAEVGTFWGSADKRENIYYCINPNSVDPVESTVYFGINPKYDYQSNYRSVPELQYMLSTLMYNADFYNKSGMPEWKLCFDNLVKAFNQIVDNIDDTSSNESGMLDNNIKVGELRNALKTLMGMNGDIEFSGEVMRKQTDSGLDHLSGNISNIGNDRAMDIVVLGFEYPVGHYMQGMPISDADKWVGMRGEYSVPVESRTLYGRAFARMFVAYTELARKKGLLDDENIQYKDIVLKLESTKINDNKIEAHYTINDVLDKGVSRYSIFIPDDLKDKVKIISPNEVLKSDSEYYMQPEALKNGFTLEVDSSLQDYEIEKIKVKKYFKDKTIARTYSAKQNYRYDVKSQRWFIREMVAANVEGFVRKSDQTKQGLGYGQELIKFSKERNDVVKEVSILIPQIRTAVCVDLKGKKYNGFILDKKYLQSTLSNPAKIDFTDQELNEGINIIDRVEFSGIDISKKYKLISVLNEVTEKNEVKPIKVKVSDEFKPVYGSLYPGYKYSLPGIVDFGNLKNLERGKKYVVYQYLFNGDVDLKTTNESKDISDADKDKILASHTNPSNTEQTFIILKPINIHVEKRWSDKSSDKEVVIRLLKSKTKFIDIPPEGSTPPIHTTIMMFALPYVNIPILNEFNSVEYEPVCNPDGTEVVLRLNKDNKYNGEFNNLPEVDEYGNKIEYKIVEDDVPGYTSEITGSVEDGFIVNNKKNSEIKTTVEVNGNKSTDILPVNVDANNNANVIDHIDYSGLAEKTEYTFVGRLMKIESNGNEKSVAISSKQKIITTSSGSIDIEFNNVKLEPGHKYVVYEYALEGNQEEVNFEGGEFGENGVTVGGKEISYVAKHADNRDKAQTVIVNPEKPTPTPEPKLPSLRTVAQAGEIKASETEEAKVDKGSQVVKDTVKYTNLDTSKTYTIVGRLMDITDESKISQKAISKSEPFKPESSEGEKEINFGIQSLEPGHKYVVYEYALEGNQGEVNFEGGEFGENGVTVGGKEIPYVAKHADNRDKAQTVIVNPEKPTPPTPTPRPPKPEPEGLKGNLRTTVEVNGKRATKEFAVEVDSNTSAMVVDHVDYSGLVQGKEYTFMGRLMEIGLDGSEKVVATVSRKITLESSDGTVDVVFSKVKLEAGKTYVVYERAISTENLVENNTKQHIIVHEDKDDKSQTIKVNNKPDNNDNSNNNNNDNSNNNNNDKKNYHKKDTTSKIRRLSNAPKTGDNSKFTLHTGLFMVSGLMLYLFKKNKRGIH